MLKVNGVHAGYGDGNVLHNLSFTVPDKEIYVLLGPNGAGKTTAFRVVSGILPPVQGRVFIDEIDVWEEPEKAKTSIGYLPEGERVYLDLSVYKNLKFFCKIYNIEEKRIDQLLEEFGLEKYKSAKAGFLSRGLRKRLAIIRALLHDPKVLVLDEPFSNLDISTVLNLRDRIFELLEEGKTILFSTHILSELQNFESLKCKVGIIKDGRLILEENVGELMNKVENVEVVFKVDKREVAKKILERYGYDVKYDSRGITVRVLKSREVSTIIRILLDNDIEVYESKLRETPIEKIFTDIT